MPYFQLATAGPPSEDGRLLVFIHAVDNGKIALVPDSGGAKMAKTVAMTLAAGPIGLAAGAATREVSAVCSVCDKTLTRHSYSAVVIRRLHARVLSGDIVIRRTEPNAIPEYDSNEQHFPLSEVVEERKARTVAAGVPSAIVFGVLSWCCVAYGIVAVRPFTWATLGTVAACALIALFCTRVAVRRWPEVVQAIEDERQAKLRGPLGK